MGKLGVEHLKPGMVLAGDLVSPQGRMLLGKGAVVEERHLRICKIWGVTEADVEGVDAAEQESASLDVLPDEVVAAARKLTAKRFARANVDHPAVREFGRLFTLDVGRRMAACGVEAVLGEYPDLPSAQERADRDAQQPPYPTLDVPPPHEIASRELSLASLPDVFVRIVETLKNPYCSASYVAEVVSMDVSLAARLLRLVNSPFYGFPQKIDTLGRAVTIIGSNHLVNLAVGVSVISMFENVPARLLDMKSFWKHSAACGVVARLLAGGVGNLNEERFFVAGLLHDIGRLALLKNYPDAYAAVLEEARARAELLSTVEKAMLGFTHAKLGGALFKEWKFPASLERMVRMHHAPAGDTPDVELGVIHVANVMVSALDVGMGGEVLAPPIDPVAWRALGRPKSSLGELKIQMEHQLADILHIFFESR